MHSKLILKEHYILLLKLVAKILNYRLSYKLIVVYAKPLFQCLIIISDWAVFVRSKMLHNLKKTTKRFLSWKGHWLIVHLLLIEQQGTIVNNFFQVLRKVTPDALVFLDKPPAHVSLDKSESFRKGNGTRSGEVMAWTKYYQERWQSPAENVRLFLKVIFQKIVISTKRALLLIKASHQNCTIFLLNSFCSKLHESIVQGR